MNLDEKKLVAQAAVHGMWGFEMALEILAVLVRKGVISEQESDAIIEIAKENRLNSIRFTPAAEVPVTETELKDRTS